VIYFCADDYALNDISSKRILSCIENGVLNKVSVFPNFADFDINDLLKAKNVRISLHLNLVEGKCLSDSKDIDLLVDEYGNFKHTFAGLFKLWLLKRKKLEEQLYKEIKSQILFFKSRLPENVPFCIDSHQHTHMIPSVFKTIIKVLKEENIKIDYMRIPFEPILPFIKTPSLYFTYSPINVIKQWLLNLLWLKNKNLVKNMALPYSYFFGILFSGKMDKKRVLKILPHYLKLSKKKNKDIEVLFHPGYLEKEEIDLENRNVNFEKFYLSSNRKTEFKSVIELSERGVLNALY
jgi:predicted glycoside hydrolase/deacetylase ChbG (UPF0249 family)